MDFVGTRAVVTGGTRGIGRAICERLIAEGARVLACGASAEGVARAMGRGIAAVQVDVTETEDVRYLASAVDSTLGGVDLLIHCAGIQRSWDLVRQPSVEEMERELDVNLMGPMRVTQGLLPRLLESECPTIVSVTSILAWTPKASAPVYCASKAGLASWTRSVRSQLAPLGVRVLELIPPVVATAMTAGRGEGAVSPERVAEELMRGLRGRATKVAVGKAALAEVLHRFAPGLLSRKVASL